jgi:hypothetical protein
MASLHRMARIKTNVEEREVSGRVKVAHIHLLKLSGFFSRY